MINNQLTAFRADGGDIRQGRIKEIAENAYGDEEKRRLAQRVLVAEAELQEHRKAAEPELKPANLVNKFYERYPLASFKSDTERASALGYFMAGAELQCFGEYVKYEDLCSDE